MKLEFDTYKESLFKILHGENYSEEFLILIDQLYQQGYSKFEIYKLFLTLHENIQIDLVTKDDMAIYDRLSDFMDGFTTWGKNFKILPHEDDC